MLRWRRRELVLEDVVTAFEPPRQLGIRGSWKAASFAFDLVLEPAGADQTVVTFDWTLRPRSILMRAAVPLLKGSLRRATVEEAEGLKAYAEGRRSGY